MEKYEELKNLITDLGDKVEEYEDFKEKLIDLEKKNEDLTSLLTSQIESVEKKVSDASDEAIEKLTKENSENLKKVKDDYDAKLTKIAGSLNIGTDFEQTEEFEDNYNTKFDF